MARWDLFPPGGGIIYEQVNGRQTGKVIGRFSHYGIQKDSLVGLRVENGPLMEITNDSITVEGYEKPWVAVTYMNTDDSRRSCAGWVWQLICEGKFEHHKRDNKEAIHDSAVYL
jgi:hypothetical protein